ncbi:hypothetical protein BC833DRAFT_113324 [Globomyces pollinis-pini]|nr:hypothetical protein BC833DRAFT_113324 [Globomyces pollinis-pini]
MKKIFAHNSLYKMKRDYTKDYQDRPARIQLDYRNTQPTDTGGTWNVYYSKYSGDGSRFAKGTIIPAEHRVVIDRDAGKTRASSKMPFCIHFAHGKCSRGHNCTFLHRIPMKGDRVETTIDCFGRDKFRNHREDMGGVGSFEHRTRTLYVGNVAINDHMEEICRNHFSEFGEIEYLNVLPGKGVVFIQYTHINNAEFAKEAMEGQTLESSEIINVRWASEDPNPHGKPYVINLKVVETLKRKTEETVIETIRAQLPIVGDKGTILDYEDSFKRPKVEAPVHKDISREKETQLEKVS